MAGRNTGGGAKTTSYPSAMRYKTDVNIVERVWDIPQGTTPKAGLVLIHGGMWHGGWFGELGDFLASSDYCIRVSAPDLVSHGLSDDPVPGYRSYVPDFSHQAEEVRAAIARARAVLPGGTPIFLLGESVGGLTVLQHLLVHEADVDGLILCGAVIQIQPALLPPRMIIPMLKGLGRLWPTLPLPGQDFGGDTFDRAFGDPSVAPVAREDPLVIDKGSPRLGFIVGLLDAVDLVKQKAPEMTSVKSVLMMHYKGDERVSYEACKAVVDSMPIQDKVYMPLDGDFHQIFQDTPEKSRKFAEDVARFIVERAT